MRRTDQSTNKTFNISYLTRYNCSLFGFIYQYFEVLRVFSIVVLLVFSKAIIERTFYMDQNTLNKLANLANNDDKGNRQAFKNVVIKLGVKPVQHFPKLKGKDGKAVKDKEGNELRSKVSDGYTFTFSDFETSRVVKVILNKKYDIKVMNAYLVSGYGYDIRSGNMIYIDRDVTIQEYK